MKKNTFLCGVIALFLFQSLSAQTVEIKMPKGRIAISSDGNLHDSDDWGATAFSLAFISYAGLGNRLVHYDYSNHLGESRKTWEAIMTDAAKGGAKRFGLKSSKIFDDQTEKAKAIKNFVKEANKSTADNPLWFVCAGPMQMAYDMIAATKPDKRKFIHAISHGKWNEIHHHGLSDKTWDDMQKDFPEVNYHQILDQNKSNGEDDFQSHISNWQWLKESKNSNWQWLYSLDDTHQVDELEKWKSDTKEKFDISDAGMTYWLITGGPNGGNEKGGWKEVYALFNHLPVGDLKDLKIYTSTKDYLLIEAESTTSDLVNWKLIEPSDKKFVANASGNAFLEFNGNKPNTGEPNSPLNYNFKINQSGDYRLLMMTSKRLEGERGDWCNDAFVKLDGDFLSATTLTTDDLKSFQKYFQEGSTKTSELSWQWALRAEKGKHEFHNLIYNLKADEDYTLTIAGRSQRFGIDYIVLYNIKTHNLEDIKTIIAKKQP